MARFRPIDDSPNERAPGPEWGSQVLEAYRDDANREFEAAQQRAAISAQMTRQFVGDLSQMGMQAFQLQRQELAQKAAFEQQKEMENLRTRNDIYKEREQYDYQTNKELERLRNYIKEVELSDYPVNVKANLIGQARAKMAGLKADPKNFAPKPPPAADQWAESRVIDKENGIVSYRQPDGKWEVKPLPADKSTKPGGIDDKTLKANQDQIDKAETAIKNEMTLKGEDPAAEIPEAAVYERVIRNLKRAGAPEETIAPWRQRLAESKAAEAGATTQPVATQPTSQPAASNFTPGKPFRTPMDAVSVVAASQQQPGTVPPARVMQALEYLLPIKDSLEPRETAVLENAKLQLIQKGKSGAPLSPEEVAMLRRLAKGG